MKLGNALILVSVAVSCIVLLGSFQKKPAFDLQSSVKRGQEVYMTYCITCHMDQGEGIEGIYPPLAKSDYLMTDKKRSVQQVLYGVSGEIKVNGKIYNQEMLGFSLTDEETSDVLNYIRNSFGNKGDAITKEFVKSSRIK